MVGVEVGEEDLRQVGQPDRADQLALGPLTAVEQDPVAAAVHEHRRQAPARGGDRAGGSGEEDGEVHGARVLSVQHDELEPPAPPPAWQMPIVWRGWRRRSVGLPGLKI